MLHHKNTSKKFKTTAVSQPQNKNKNALTACYRDKINVSVLDKYHNHPTDCCWLYGL